VIEQVNTPARTEQRRKLKEAADLLRDVLAKALMCDGCGAPLTSEGCKIAVIGDSARLVHLVVGVKEKQ
jgi:hypothetical protein